VRDPLEVGVAGVSVRLVGEDFDQNATTDGQGRYLFAVVPSGDYTVALLGTTLRATTPTSHPVPVCGCLPATAPDFGIAPSPLECNAKTPGFWSNPNGRRIIFARGLLDELWLLCVVDERGCRFATCSYTVFRRWLLGARARNMAYMLSAHVVAMYFNLRAGFVDRHCVVNDPQLGVVPITDLLRQAVLSLCLHPYTPVGSPYRAQQERLKNALDRANNNQTWM
jgi:hypothetical protein